MIRILLSLTLRTYYSIISPSEPVEVDALECKIGGCCDRCTQLNSNGSQSCIGCSGVSTSGCDSGQTYVPCPSGTCWHGDGKIVIAPSGGNDACS